MSVCVAIFHTAVGDRCGLQMNLNTQLNKHYIKLCVDLKATVKMNKVDCDHTGQFLSSICVVVFLFPVMESH